MYRTYSRNMQRDDDAFRRGRASLATAVKDDGLQSPMPHFTMRESDDAFVREYLKTREQLRTHGRRILYPTSN
jgi:hypothetical protein